MVTNAQAPRSAIVYCIVPAELGGRLHEPLRRHFAEDERVEVVVEQRLRNRRERAERRSGGGQAPPSGERRRVRGADGRRVAERRAVAVEIDAPPDLPRRAKPHVERLVFLECLAPTSEQLEDRDTRRLVARYQAGEKDVFAELYRRYFDRVYNYLRVAFQDTHEAEDATQQVFIQALQALGRYEERGKPFRVWLFVIVRNVAITSLRKRSRVDILDPAELPDRPGNDDDVEDSALSALNWISDRELLLFIERLPLAQRQVLALRFMLDLDHAQIGAILDKPPNTVAALQSRGLRFMRERLTALGRAPEAGRSAGMRCWNPQAPVLRRRRFVLM